MSEWKVITVHCIFLRRECFLVDIHSGLFEYCSNQPAIGGLAYHSYPLLTRCDPLGRICGRFCRRCRSNIKNLYVKDWTAEISALSFSRQVSKSLLVFLFPACYSHLFAYITKSDIFILSPKSEMWWCCNWDGEWDVEHQIWKAKCKCATKAVLFCAIFSSSFGFLFVLLRLQCVGYM